MKQMPLLFCFSRLEQQTNYRFENKKICMMLIDLLLNKGADINIRIDNNTGYTILMKLIDTKQVDNMLEILKFLIERGADTTIRNNDNNNIFDVMTLSGIDSHVINNVKKMKQIIFYDCKEIRCKTVSQETCVTRINTSGIIIDSKITREECCNIY